MKKEEAKKKKLEEQKKKDPNYKLRMKIIEKSKNFQ
jgi:hypothetical protein